MKDDLANEYYNNYWFQSDLAISKEEEVRIGETIALIPGICSSILDLGCGDGRITNRLTNKFGYVCGLDSSEEALKHVMTDKRLGSLNSLPFADKSFDLVLCSEVLEHLPFQIYPKALKEIERVAKKYILVTVPNRQNLKYSSISCPYCGCTFNEYRHIRSFNPQQMRSLFGQFQSKIIKPHVLTKTYPSFVFEIRRLLNTILGTTFPNTSMCPQCGYSSLPNNQGTKSKFKVNSSLPLRLGQSMIKLIPQKQEGMWLAALYERN